MLYSLLMLMLTAIIYLTPLYIWLPFKFSKKQQLILFMLIFCNLCITFFFIGNLGVLLLLIVEGIYLAFITTNRIQSIIVMILSYLFNVLWNNIVTVLIWIFLHIDVAILQNNPYYYLALILFTIVSDFFICKFLLYIFQRFWYQLNLVQLPKGTIFFICLQLMLTLLLFVINISEGQQVGYSPKVIYFNTFVFCAYFFISLWAIIRSIQIYKKDAEMQMKQESFQALQQYTAQVESLYNSLRSFKHDYSNILLTLYEYIDTRDMDGLTSYFTRNILPLTKQLDPQNAHITRLSNLNIVELKSMVTAKIIYAQEMGIDVSVEINQPLDRVNMDIIDLVRILGIFLDNAIEAALETDIPKMSFVIIQEDKETVFFMTNSFIDHHLQISELSRAGTSSKGSNRGIGLYNVAQIISHYDNLFLDTHTQGDTFIQVLHIYA